ncbi:MAG: DMT family transporter [Paludibacteraceae bacterium]|nr:DMT family transporter [Paludibacteraceae bacterium]
MWVLLAFISALCLGGYDISKKVALQQHRVTDVLTLSILISSLILCVPLLLSRCCPALMTGTHFYVPPMDAQAHLLTFVKSCIVLSSWVFAYVSLKHLPLSVVSPMQATRPMWTLIGALLIFGERLNTWQWVGVLLAIGSIFAFSFRKHPHVHLHSGIKQQISNNRYYICLVLAILIGSCSGLYDKYMMRHYDHNAVQVYYTIYQALMMAAFWAVRAVRKGRHIEDNPLLRPDGHLPCLRGGIHFEGIVPIALISIFLVISDNVYMLALRDPDSLIAVVSTIRRGGAVIGFAYGLLFLHEPEPKKKLACMIGIMLGLVCLALGSI